MADYLFGMKGGDPLLCCDRQDNLTTTWGTWYNHYAQHRCRECGRIWYTYTLYNGMAGRHYTCEVHPSKVHGWAARELLDGTWISLGGEQ